MPLGLPLKEKAAFSEQLVNKYEDQNGNKKVQNRAKKAKMTNGQKQCKILYIKPINLFWLSIKSIKFSNLTRLNNLKIVEKSFLD